uniref:NADH-ubiquinone oxidoreductase chain 4L n=1 Tax=Kleidocerys resedae resedae TaxID=1503485 RepID=A0A060B9U7_9HEMI|nr:NADH dehydrogenase subunit 4L [Kleidocerys resedae resedae]
MVFFKLLKLLIIWMFFSGLISYCFLHRHLLSTLFSLEYLVLILFLLFFLFLIKLGAELFFILIFLVFSVCEGALGLGVLVSLIRMHGNDLLSSMSILSW